MEQPKASASVSTLTLLLLWSPVLYTSAQSSESSYSYSYSDYSSSLQPMPTCVTEQTNVCNGYPDCEDLSDEIHCKYECIDYRQVVTKRQCDASLTYTKTFFPNVIFSSQDDTQTLAERVGPIRNCDPRATGFICGLLSPECPAATASGQGQAPCRHYCEEIANITTCSRIFTVSQLDLRTYVCPFMPTYPVTDNPDFCTYVELTRPTLPSEPTLPPQTTLPPEPTVPPVMPTCNLAKPTDLCNGYSNCEDASDETHCKYECIDYTEIVPSKDCSSRLSYTQTFYPNPVFATQEGAQTLAGSISLFQGCDTRALGFMCGLLVPECPAAAVSGHGQSACRRYCEEIADIPQCTQLLAIVKIDLLNDICPLLPTVPVDGNPNFCTYAGSIETTRSPTTIAPTTARYTTTELLVTTKEPTTPPTTTKPTTEMLTTTMKQTTTKMLTTTMKQSTTYILTPTVKDSKIRLIGGVSNKEGTIEVLHNNQWGTICSSRWGQKDADTACRQLGFSSAMAAFRSAYFGQGTGPVWLTSVGCKGDEYMIQDCEHPGWENNECTHADDAGVACVDQDVEHEGDIQLIGGSTEGTVQMYHNNKWGTICDTHWGFADANVVCKQLGFTGAVAPVRDAYYGEGTGPVWMDDVGCLGDENSLEDCVFNGWENNNCSHGDDAGVLCIILGSNIDLPNDKAYLTNKTDSSATKSSANLLQPTVSLLVIIVAAPILTVLRILRVNW